MLLLSAAGCFDPSYEDITASLASSHNTQSQDLASVCAGPAASSFQPAEADPQPVWDADVTDVHTPDNFPAPLLEDGSISQAGAGLVDDPLVSEETLTTLAAAGEAVALSGGRAHSHPDPSRLCSKSHIISCSSMSSQGSSHSTCSHSGRQLQLSGLQEVLSAAAGQLADAHEAADTASGLLQKGNFSVQGAQASPAGLSAEPIIERTLASPTSPCAEHEGCNHQTLNPAQQTPGTYPTHPLGGAAELTQSDNHYVQQPRAGLQAQMADSEAHRVEGSSQRAHAQVQSTDTAITGKGFAAAAASGDATPAKVS